MALGCTDPEAFNYAPTATEDDDTCYYNPPISNELGPWPCDGPGGLQENAAASFCCTVYASNVNMVDDQGRRLLLTAPSAAGQCDGVPNEGDQKNYTMAFFNATDLTGGNGQGLPESCCIPHNIGGIQFHTAAWYGGGMMGNVSDYNPLCQVFNDFGNANFYGADYGGLARCANRYDEPWVLPHGIDLGNSGKFQTESDATDEQSAWLCNTADNLTDNPVFGVEHCWSFVSNFHLSCQYPNYQVCDEENAGCTPGIACASQYIEGDDSFCSTNNQTSGSPINCSVVDECGVCGGTGPLAKCSGVCNDDDPEVGVCVGVCIMINHVLILQTMIVQLTQMSVIVIVL